MIVIQSDDVTGYWTKEPYHRELKVLLSPSLQDVSDDLSIGLVTLPPGQRGNPHTHQKEQEVWYGLEGTCVLRVGSEEAELNPGTIIVAPAGIEHQILNRGDDTAKALFLFSPAGPEEPHIQSRAS
jgi:quercetin dioxygenase-like cupin family protein